MGKLGPPPQRVGYGGFHAKARVGRVRVRDSSVRELSGECNVVVTTEIRGVMQFRHGVMRVRAAGLGGPGVCCFAATQ